MALKSHISSNTYLMKPYYSVLKGNSPWNINIKKPEITFSPTQYINIGALIIVFLTYL